MVSKDVMQLDADNNFDPEGAVKRGDFVKMLVKVLGHDNLDVCVENPYTDINGDTENFAAIMKDDFNLDLLKTTGNVNYYPKILLVGHIEALME